MAGRGPQTFKKRQKEQQRKEKQEAKMAQRLQRKQDKPASSTDEEFVIDPETGRLILTPEQQAEQDERLGLTS